MPVCVSGSRRDLSLWRTMKTAVTQPCVLGLCPSHTPCGTQAWLRRHNHTLPPMLALELHDENPHQGNSKGLPRTDLAPCWSPAQTSAAEEPLPSGSAVLCPELLPSSASGCSPTRHRQVRTAVHRHCAGPAFLWPSYSFIVLKLL